MNREVSRPKEIKTMLLTDASLENDTADCGAIVIKKGENKAIIFSLEIQLQQWCKEMRLDQEKANSISNIMCLEAIAFILATRLTKGWGAAPSLEAWAINEADLDEESSHNEPFLSFVDNQSALLILQKMTCQKNIFMSFAAIAADIPIEARLGYVRSANNIADQMTRISSDPTRKKALVEKLKRSGYRVLEVSAAVATIELMNIVNTFKSAGNQKPSTILKLLKTNIASAKEEISQQLTEEVS